MIEQGFEEHDRDEREKSFSSNAASDAMEDHLKPQNPASDDAYLNMLVKKAKLRFKLTDYEGDFLKTLNQELRKPTPSARTAIQERMMLLDSLRVKLLNMLYLLTDRMDEYAYSYYEKYNSEFKILVRQGRPSTQAIETEIHTNADMQEKKMLLKGFDDFKGLLFGYIKTIDNCKATCFEKIKGA